MGGKQLRGLLSSSGNIRRSSFIWNLLSAAVNSFQTMLLLVFITRFGTDADSAAFVMAYAAGNLLFNIGKYGVRHFQVTDSTEQYSFRDYISARFVSLAVMAAAVVLFILTGIVSRGYTFVKAAVVLLICLYKGIEAAEDVFHGRMQQQGRLDIAGRILFIRISSFILCYAVLFVLTHDSIGVGEDGPTHEPIEQIASLRATPGVLVFRPADAKETAVCYLAALEQRKPAAMALTRQNLPQLEGSGPDALRGGYIVYDSYEDVPDLILMASGSEVSLCVEAAETLVEEGTSVRVVSIPCMELFDQQDEEYRESVLPRSVRARIAVEAGASLPWGKYVGLDGTMICIDRFGQSGKYAELFKAYGFTAEHVAEEARKLLSK